MNTPPRSGRPMTHPPTLFEMPAEPAPGPVPDGPPLVGAPRRVYARKNAVFIAILLAEINILYYKYIS